MIFNPFGFTATRNPLRDLERLVEDLNASFNRGGARANTPKAGDVPLNVWSNNQGLMITAEIPGVDPSSVAVNVLGDTVTITGKRPRGEDGGDLAFTRTVHLPYRVDADRTAARYSDGVLNLTLPRPEAERPRTIAVKSA